MNRTVCVSESKWAISVGSLKINRIHHSKSNDVRQGLQERGIERVDFGSPRLHIFSSPRLQIFSSPRFHIFSSARLHIFRSPRLHIFSSRRLLIFSSPTISSFHLGLDMLHTSGSSKYFSGLSMIHKYFRSI